MKPSSKQKHYYYCTKITTLNILIWCLVSHRTFADNNENNNKRLKRNKNNPTRSRFDVAIPLRKREIRQSSTHRALSLINEILGIRSSWDTERSTDEQEPERSAVTGDELIAGSILYDKTILCYYNGRKYKTLIVSNSIANQYKLRGATDGACPESDDDSRIQAVMDAIRLPTPSKPFEDTPALAPTPYPECVPTIGDCIGSFDAFVKALDNEGQPGYVLDGDTIAICGGSTITTTDELQIQKDNITVCCESGPRECTMTTGADVTNTTNLVIFGSSATVRGITFRNGNKLDVLGGNLAIDTAGIRTGNHLVDQCSFEDGYSSDAGGNLFIGGGASITVSNCLFTGGNGSIAGGNLFLRGAPEVQVINNRFMTGNASFGGNVYASNITRFTATGNVFDAGRGETGAGMEIRLVQSSITVTGNTFTNNIASQAAGSLAILSYSKDDVTIDTSTNDGTENVAPVCPEIYLVPFTPDEPICLTFNESGPSPTNTPVAMPTTSAPVTFEPSSVTTPTALVTTAPVPVTTPITSSPAPTAPVSVTTPIGTSAPITIPTTEAPIAVPPALVPTPSTNNIFVLVEKFYISFATSGQSGEPTLDEIDTVVTRTEEYLKLVFDRYLPGLGVDNDLVSVDLVQEGYLFNPDNKPGNIYLEFPTATFYYTDEGTPPSLLVTVLLMNSELNDDYVTNIIKPIGGSFVDVNGVFFGATT